MSKYSDGEDIINNYLKSHYFIRINDNMKHTFNKKKWYVHSCTPKWLKGLHLDFYIRYENISIGIEYDGRQHFSCDKHFYHGNYAKFQSSRERDRKKDMLCSLHSCYLIRLEDIGDLISTNTLVAEPIIKKALTTGISKVLYLKRHSHICGIVKEPISWYNKYYSSNYKRTVIDECSNSASKLSKLADRMRIGINKLKQKDFSVNKKIYQYVGKAILLVKSTVAKIGVLEPELKECLIYIQNNILMGFLQFYTRPSSLGFDKNTDDEELTCRVMKQFATQILNDIRVVKFNNAH